MSFHRTQFQAVVTASGGSHIVALRGKTIAEVQQKWDAFKATGAYVISSLKVEIQRMEVVDGEWKITERHQALN